MGDSASCANHGIDNCRHRLAATIRRIVMADDPKPIVDDRQTDRSFRPSGYMTLANHVAATQVMM